MHGIQTSGYNLQNLNILQSVKHENLQSLIFPQSLNILQSLHILTHCNTLQRIATHCNTLQSLIFPQSLNILPTPIRCYILRRVGGVAVMSMTTPIPGGVTDMIYIFRRYDRSGNVHTMHTRYPEW